VSAVLAPPSRSGATLAGVTGIDVATSIGTCVAPIEHPQEPTDRLHAVYRPTDTVTIGPGERDYGDDRAALGAPDVPRPGLGMRTVGGEVLGNDRRTGAQTQLSRTLEMCLARTSSARTAT
jgi:hypothetical protein